MVKLLDLQAITMMHGDEYKAAANRVIESGWFLQGNENKQFEVNEKVKITTPAFRRVIPDEEGRKYNEISK